MSNGYNRKPATYDRIFNLLKTHWICDTDTGEIQINRVKHKQRGPPSDYLGSGMQSVKTEWNCDIKLIR